MSLKSVRFAAAMQPSTTTTTGGTGLSAQDVAHRRIAERIQWKIVDRCLQSSGIGEFRKESEMQTLKQKHEEYIAKVKANGGKTLTFKAPCCGKEIEDRAGVEGETWDTLASCPHCGALYVKITTATEITGSIPANA